MSPSLKLYALFQRKRQEADCRREEGEKKGGSTIVHFISKPTKDWIILADLKF